MVWRQFFASILSIAIFAQPMAYAESTTEGFSEGFPLRKQSLGEFIHGQGEGKVLIRTLMIGAIPYQGIHYVPEGTDLLYGLLYAGGQTQDSQTSSITIRRAGVRGIIEVDLEGLIEGGKPLPLLRDGDIISIPYNYRHNLPTVTTMLGAISGCTGLIVSLIALLRR